MPEVFDHFFRLLGTTRRARARPRAARPRPTACTPRPATGAAPLDVRVGARGRHRAVRARSSRAPGAALDDYLDSARRRVRPVGRPLPLRHVRDAPAACATRELLRGCRSSRRCCTQPLADRTSSARSATRGCGRSSATRPCSSADRPYRRAEPVPPHEPPRPRRRRALPAGRLHRVIDAIERLARARAASPSGPAPRGAIVTADDAATAARSRRRRTSMLDGRPPHVDADVVVSAADLHHTETDLLPRRPAAPTPRVVGPARRRARARCSLMLGVDGRAARSSRTTPCSSPTDWRRELRRHLRPEPAHPRARVVVRLPPERDRPHGRAGGAREPVRARPGARRSVARPRRRRRRRRRRRSRPPPTAVIAQIAAWCGIPDLAERIVVRRTVAPGDFAADLQRLARQRARPRPHAAPERGVPAAQRVARRSTGSYYAGGVDASRASACRCASSRPSSCSSACAATARPARCPSRARV